MDDDHYRAFPTSRMKGETAVAFQAFKAYLDLGDTRTIVRLSQSLNKSTALLGVWSSRWCWQKRLITHEHEVAEAQRRVEAQAALDHARERIARRSQVEDTLWDLGAKLKEKAEAMLAFPVSKQQEIMTPEGKKLLINPGKWTFGDVVRMVAVIKDVSTFAAGMPSVRHEFTGKDGGPIVPLAAADAPMPELHIVIKKEGSDIPLFATGAADEDGRNGDDDDEPPPSSNGPTFKFSRS
jgi:hypothetical protein